MALYFNVFTISNKHFGYHVHGSQRINPNKYGQPFDMSLRHHEAKTTKI